MLQMNLLFFQNCISPHQIPYIRECAKDERVERVHLIVPRADYVLRKDMGWDSTHLLDNTSVQLWLKPTDEQVIQLLKETKDSICLYTGVRADADVFRWLKLSLNYPVKRGIITEPPNVYPTKPLWLHYIRFLLQDYVYVKYIHYVFAFGNLAVKYYRFWSKKWSVIPFAYCTDNARAINCSCPLVTDKLRLIFVGSLTRNKNVVSVLKALSAIQDDTLFFDIVGDGEERKHLEDFVVKNQVRNVTFYGYLPMNGVSSVMNQADILVLPSHYDGWGAVVNEALQLGLYVICSKHCGSKSLLVNDRIGFIYHSYQELRDKIQNVILNREQIKKERLYRKKWADAISGESISKYLIDNLCNSIGNDIVEPWKRM